MPQFLCTAMFSARKPETTPNVIHEQQKHCHYENSMHVCVCHVALAHDIEHWHLSDTIGPACLLLLPWQRASVHADGRCDGEGGLEGGRLRIRLHR